MFDVGHFSPNTTAAIAAAKGTPVLLDVYSNTFGLVLNLADVSSANLNGRLVAAFFVEGLWSIGGLLSGHLSESPANGEQRFFGPGRETLNQGPYKNFAIRNWYG